MGNLLFSPSGRINSGEFIKGAIILIIISILLSLPTILGLGQGIEMIMGLLSYLLIVPWIFLWIKRYHDAGKQGAMCLIPIIVFILGAGAIMAYFMSDIWGLAMEAASQGSEVDEEEILALTKRIALPSTIASTVWSLIVALGFNAIIKHQPEENQYGHPS